MAMFFLVYFLLFVSLISKWIAWMASNFIERLRSVHKHNAIRPGHWSVSRRTPNQEILSLPSKLSELCHAASFAYSAVHSNLREVVEAFRKPGSAPVSARSLQKTSIFRKETVQSTVTTGMYVLKNSMKNYRPESQAMTFSI